MRNALRIIAVAAAGTLVLAGCSSSSKKSTASTGSATSAASSTAVSSTAAPVTGKVTVLAAASLSEAFTTIGKQFKVAHPGADIVFNFEASSAAAAQITAGVKADVFASASPKNMTSVKTFVTSPANFVSNSL